MRRAVLFWAFTGFTAVVLALSTVVLWQRQQALYASQKAESGLQGTLLLAVAPPGDKSGEIYTLDLATGERKTLATGVNVSEVIATEDGSRLAYVRYQEEQFALYVLDVSSGEEKELFRVDSTGVNALRLSSWSPDGEHFFVIAASSTGRRPSGKVYLASVSEGKLYKLGQGLLTAWPVWLPDGSLALYGLKTRGYPAVFAVDPANPRPKEVDMVSESLAVSPDGEEVAYATYSYTRGANELRVWNVKTEESRSVASGALSGNNKSVLFWSPDGSAIFYLAGPSFVERDVYVVREGEAPRNLTREVAGIVTEAVLNPDAKRLAVGVMRSLRTFEGDIFLVDVETGEDERLLESKRTPAWLQWSPDGKFLAFSELEIETKGHAMAFNITGSSVSVLNLDTGEVHPIAEGTQALVLKWLE